MKFLFSITLFAFLAISASAQTPDSVTLRKLIIEQSKEGGQLDYFTRIKGKETIGSQVKPGIYAQNIHIAWFYWGKTNYVIGIKSLDEVSSIFKEWKKREPTRMEYEHIKLGFNDREK